MNNLQLLLTLLCFARYYLHSAADLTASTASQIVLPSHEIAKRVVGDVDCKIEDFPYLVSFRKQNSKAIFCSGTLITLVWSLTAAHCFEKTTVLSILKGMADAYAGSTSLDVDQDNIDENTQVQMRYVHLVFLHNKYDSLPSFRHDIALVKFQRHFELSDWIHIAALPRHKETEQCKLAVIPGWGKEVGLQETLKCAYNTTISSSADCQNAWRWEFTGETICSADLEGKSIGPCLEDAGSPLICQGLNNSDVVVGIFSQNKGCTTPKQLMLYSKVEAYLNWIDTTMRNGALRITSNVYVLILILLVHVMISQNL